MTTLSPDFVLRSDVRAALDIAIPELHKLRDDFAKAALQGELASQHPGFVSDNYGVGDESELAWWSYQMADAMLEAKFK